jgi:hypothetical protein
MLSAARTPIKAEIDLATFEELARGCAPALGSGRLQCCWLRQWVLGIYEAAAG